VAKKKEPVYCCRWCGRDTTARGGVCPRCFRADPYGAREESKGRRSRHVTEAKSPFDDVAERDDLPPDPYHGDTIRDDI
jgi:predicted ATP-dependent serine protease